MDKVIINVPGTTAWEVTLKPGLNRFGRSLNTDVQISHPSVSSLHCDIFGKDGAWTIKDLGSTNGTTLDGTAIKEGPLQLGQTLRLGEVEIVFATAATPIRIRVTAPAAVAPEEAKSVPSKELPIPPPVPGLPTRGTAAKAKVPGRANRGFYAGIPAAFVFPFRRNGLILLGGGAVLFVVLNFASRYAGIVGLGIGIFCGGYLFAFLKSILTAAALGDEEMPDWPDYESWITSGLSPFLELLGLLALCLGPAWFYFRFADDPQVWIGITLLIGGLIYLPMALLAMGIYDSIAAINPMVVVVSIVRVPLEYLAACAVLGLLAFGVMAADRWLEANANVPILAPVITEFLGLYTLAVVARLMGQLYYDRKERLNWKLGGG